MENGSLLTINLNSRRVICGWRDCFVAFGKRVLNPFDQLRHCKGLEQIIKRALAQSDNRSIERLAQNLFLAPPTTAQHAALAAFDAETQAILEDRRLAFKARRDFLLPALRDLGFGLPLTPAGAFYLYADVSRLTGDSFAFAERLLEEVGVAVTPGRDFGEVTPERYVRFAYTRPLSVLQQAVERISRFLAGKSA